MPRVWNFVYMFFAFLYPFLTKRQSCASHVHCVKGNSCPKGLRERCRTWRQVIYQSRFFWALNNPMWSLHLPFSTKVSVHAPPSLPPSLPEIFAKGQTLLLCHCSLSRSDWVDVTQREPVSQKNSSKGPLSCLVCSSEVIFGEITLRKTNVEVSLTKWSLNSVLTHFFPGTVMEVHCFKGKCLSC